MKKSQEIRRSFLHYFKSHSHAIVPSSPVVPYEDPTLLFTNAGMNQFKDLFLGKSTRDYTRASTTQKCIRVGGKHNDLENVGHTSRHLTFFEMLGNFSFGDYFKKEAIRFAWDVTTHVFGFDPEKIWVSVFKDDDEAFQLWESFVSTDKIVRFGEKENFWAMGDVGPCGPCSELLYDRGPSYGNAQNPYEDLSGERFLEFWNLVFMQLSRDEKGRLSPLPKPCIDTGTGLERVCSLAIGVDSVFLTDIFQHLIAKIEKVSGKKYKNSPIQPAFHVIADHIRSLSFAIADGAIPGNADRGYILRKLVRRASRYGRTLGMEKPFLAQILPSLIEAMGEDFPELTPAEARIGELLTLEEEAFLKTLQRGGNLLAKIVEKSKKSENKISGEDAFLLKDTYGLPVEEITLLAKDEHLTVDLPRFETLEEQAKEKSRKAQKGHVQKVEENLFADFLKEHKASTFVGYDCEDISSTILAIFADGKFVNALEKGQKGALILAETPFYAEGGGQMSDSGRIEKKDASFSVTECSSPYSGIFLHQGEVKEGFFKVQDKIHALIDKEKRKKIRSNHTATHLLHFALQQVLGEHIRQAGSSVEDKRLRFDFHHHKALTPKELRTVEEIVNEKIRENLPIQIYEKSYEEIQKQPEVKQFFGEKYGARVRIVDIGFSKELCGGTHASRSGDIGLFKILKEGSISSGVRRIEAVTGKEAEALFWEKEELLSSIASLVKAQEAQILSSIKSLQEKCEILQVEAVSFQQKILNSLATSLVFEIKKIGSIPLLTQEVPVKTEELLSLADLLISKTNSAILVLASRQEGKCQILIKITPDLVAKGFSAQALIQEIVPLIQGKGGGKKEFAQAGGTKGEALSAAFNKIRALVSKE